MKKQKAKVNFERSLLIFIKDHFTMIKCITILLVFILTSVVIWLLITRIPGHGIKDYSSTVCWNFKFSLTNKTYLPSEIITLSGSCDSANGTKAFCPLWNFSSAAADFKVLHDNSIEDGQGCKRSMQIQVVDFKTTRKRSHLLVEINYPKTEPLKEINIERSDDGEFCLQSRDCHFQDEFCSPSGSCTCPERWIFIRNIQKCVPAVFKVKEHCDFTAQCQIPKTTCRNSSCECNMYYTSDLTSTQCVPEEIYKVKGLCLLTSQCKFPNSVCHKGRCDCVQHYVPNFNSTQCILEEIYKVKGLCLFTSQCKFANSVCHNGRCECVQHYTPNFDSTQCVLEIYKVKGLCLHTSQCKFPNSVCHNGKCECVQHYTPNFDSTQCIPEEIYEVKGLCLLTSQCKISNSVCYSGRCECDQYYSANFDSTQCIPEGRNCGQSCLIDENCQIQNANSVCKRSRCDCFIDSYDSRNDHRYDSGKDRYPKGDASSKSGLGWIILILVVSTLYTYA